MPMLDLEALLQQVPESNAAKSARRIFFNYVEESLEERGYFHVDLMHGSGSSVLLRSRGVFFLLTARHVLSNNVSLGFQNESPFWVSVHSRPRWQSLLDFLFPRRIWNLCELIELDLPGVDSEDICLIELFAPIQGINPEHFVDLDADSNNLLMEDQFFDSQVLVACGYPFRLNRFSYDDPPEGFTHTTTVHKQLVPGVLRIQENREMFLSFCMSQTDITHEYLDGMSGGPVLNVMPDVTETKLAGIALSGGNNICRFYPSYAIYPAILRYQECSCQVVDPASDFPNPQV